MVLNDLNFNYPQRLLLIPDCDSSINLSPFPNTTPFLSPFLKPDRLETDLIQRINDLSVPLFDPLTD